MSELLNKVTVVVVSFLLKESVADMFSGMNKVSTCPLLR